ncbi:MAG TPA: hypothetical protein VFU89_00095 [Rhabdochlamydiaceae bacterium]|nr:hypothetical protein [Rhabdochlamydiaceae bacterium]
MVGPKCGFQKSRYAPKQSKKVKSVVCGLCMLPGVLFAHNIEAPNGNVLLASGADLIGTLGWLPFTPSKKVNDREQIGKDQSGQISRHYHFEASASVADFYPLSHLVRKVYHSHIPYYRLELDYIHFQPIDIWASGSYVHSEGHSIGGHHSTMFNLWTIGVGPKYSFTFYRSFGGYLSAGPSCVILSMRNSGYVKKHINKETLGALAEFGLTLSFLSRGVLGIFAQYSYAHFNNSGLYHCVKETDIDMSALVFGGTLGIKF